MVLFDRDRSGVFLTPQGREFVDGAAVLLENANELERRTGMAASGAQGRVRFGMAPMPARALLSAALRERLADAPQLINDVAVRNVDALWPLLTAGEIEFFVSAEGQVPDAPPVKAEVLGYFPISFIVRRGHPILAEQAGATFPTLISGAGGRPLPDDLIGLANGSPHVIEDFGTLAAITASSDAIWQSSSFAVSNEIKAGILEEIPRPRSNQPTQARIVMYTLERRTQSPGAKLLKQAFRQRIRELAEFHGQETQDIGSETP